MIIANNAIECLAWFMIIYKKRFMRLVTLMILWLAFAGCSKDVTELPPATQTGENTFGCMLDGAFWTPEGFGIVPTAPILEARFIDDNIKINARNFSVSPTETEFEIYLKNVSETGIYPLNKKVSIYPNQTESYAYHIKRKIRPLDQWVTNASFTGVVNITKLDRANKIVSGTFEFRAESMTNPGEFIIVTEGRFDIKLI